MGSRGRWLLSQTSWPWERVWKWGDVTGTSVFTSLSRVMSQTSDICHIMLNLKPKARSLLPHSYLGLWRRPPHGVILVDCTLGDILEKTSMWNGYIEGSPESYIPPIMWNVSRSTVLSSSRKGWGRSCKGSMILRENLWAKTKWESRPDLRRIRREGPRGGALRGWMLPRAYSSCGPLHQLLGIGLGLTTPHHPGAGETSPVCESTWKKLLKQKKYIFKLEMIRYH